MRRSALEELEEMAARERPRSRRRNDARRGACLALGLWLVPGLAFAELSGEAKQRFDEGSAFYERQEFERARAALLQAVALAPDPVALALLAQSELRSERAAEAIEHFNEALASGANRLDGAEIREIELGLAAAKGAVGTLTVVVSEPGAKVVVDGRARGTAPLSAPLNLDPGLHRVAAFWSGGRDEAELEVQKGETYEVRLGAATHSALGVTLPVEKTGQGREVTDPVEPSEPHPGSAGRRESVRSWFSHNVSPWVGSGLAVGFLGAGAGLAVAASSHVDRADRVRSMLLNRYGEDASGSGPCAADAGEAYGSNYIFPPNTLDPNGERSLLVRGCNDYYDSRERGQSYQTLAIVGFGLGAAAAVGTLVWYFVDAKREPESVAAVQLVPVLTGQARALVLQGQF